MGVLILKASTHGSDGIWVALLCKLGQCLKCSLLNSRVRMPVVLIRKANTHGSDSIWVAILCNLGQCLYCSLPNVLVLMSKFLVEYI